VHKDRIMAIIVFVIAVFLFTLSARLPVSSVEQDQGPAVFPQVVAVALALLALGLFFAAGVKKKEEKPKEISQALDEIQEIDEPFRAKVKRVVICIFLFACYNLSLPILGFIATTVVFGIAFLMLLFGMRWLKTIAPAIVIALFAFVLFEIGFGIPLPKFLQFIRS
jgi:putative tricarboxylic transport membrane protein